MNLMLYMSPIAVLVLLPAAIVMEPNVMEATVALAVKHKFMWILLLINSTMAYGANLCNFLVTKHTSALTLQVYLFGSFVTFCVTLSLNLAFWIVLGFRQCKRGRGRCYFNSSFPESCNIYWNRWLFNDRNGRGCLWRSKTQTQIT